MLLLTTASPSAMHDEAANPFEHAPFPVQYLSSQRDATLSYDLADGLPVLISALWLLNVWGGVCLPHS